MISIAKRLLFIKNVIDMPIAIQNKIKPSIRFIYLSFLRNIIESCKECFDMLHLYYVIFIRCFYLNKNYIIFLLDWRKAYEGENEY